MARLSTPAQTTMPSNVSVWLSLFRLQVRRTSFLSTVRASTSVPNRSTAPPRSTDLARAARIGIPTIALAGTIGKGVDQTFAHGISAFASILKRPCTLEEAIRDGERLLRRAAEDAMRMMSVGIRMSRRHKAA
ncbi:glycerate kinase [Thalassococcus sp. CAU 1522]|uniref:Glycerate kinase n=1 Tax=Thalassococcus arenae TaxID=2851652 RepID=A0ABS6NBX2_9RHOB|nr:glycerate kinase [Thalassococcus arenae]